MEQRTDQELGRRWILIVDGDAQTQRILDLSLRNAGFDVKTVGAGTEALAWLAENRTDLIVADTELAGSIDGFELCRRIKQLPDHARVPFIFLADPTVQVKMHGVEVGADDFLVKPLSVQELLVRARALLQRRERERLLALAQDNERFVGDLGDIPIIDLLRALEPGRKSGVVHLAGPGNARGEIYFRHGAVVDAEAGRLSGREAIYRLFSWGNGRFEIEWKSIRRKDTIEMEPAALLMEALRRVDEWRRLLGDVPPLDTIFEVDYRLLAERLAEIPDEVNTILRLFDGMRTFIQVIDDCGLGDLEAVAVIGKLYRERIISDIKVHGESEDIPGADIEGWLTEASGPFRAAPEPARRDLFGSGPHSGGVHDRTTTPLDPLEDGGREALADDMRARFTDRLNTEGPAVEAHADGVSESPPPVTAEGAAGPPPLATPPPVPATASGRHAAAADAAEITLQGVGSAYQHPRPITSPGFAAAVVGGPPPAGGLPEVTPHLRAATPPPPPAGEGDGVPEPLVALEGESAIVVPLRPPAPERPPSTPGPDDARSVAGEIVARKSTTRSIRIPFSEPAEEAGARVAQLRDSEAPPARSTEPGLGPGERDSELQPLAAADVAEVAPWPRSAAVVAAADGKGAPSGELPVDDDMVVRPGSRVRKVLAVLFGMGVVGVGLLLVPRHPPKEDEGTAERAARTPAVARSADSPLAASALGAAEHAAGAAPAPPPAPIPEQGKPIALSEVSAVRPKTPLPGPSRPGPTRRPSPGAPAASDEMEERAADPKLARALPTEFPQLLAACRTAFVDKRMADAEVACVAAQDANPTSAEANALLAHALYNRNRRREALEWAERAIAIDPKLADAYVIVGGVHQEAGEMGEAKAAYKKYLQLSPGGQYAGDLRAIVDGQK